MSGNGSNIDAINREILNQIKLTQELADLNKRINSDFTGFLNGKKEQVELEKKIRDLQVDLDKHAGEQSETLDILREQQALNIKIRDAQAQQLKNVSLIKLGYKEMEKTSMALFTGSIVGIVKYLLDADKAFKSLNLELGMSNSRSKLLLGNLTNAAGYAAGMGVSFEELTKVQSAYSEEMGRSVLLTGDNLQNIVDIGKGTSLGLDVAAKMAGKFNLIGKSVKSTKDFYEDAVNSSIKFGVSVDAVLKTFNENFEKSQGYVFKGGIDGLKKMSQYSTKFKVDMSSVFNALDKANGLEGAVDMAAQLQVIGGKFASQDPFKLLYQARNDAEGFTKTMQGMTKGMATWNKTSGEFEIQAGDLNRLKLAADATGMSYEGLIKQAKQGAQLDSIFSQLSGSGLSPDAKEFVQGVAQIQKDGSFKIQLPDGSMRDIRNTTTGQITALMQSNKALEGRAKEAQAFDEMFKNIIMELKATLLPILKVVQSATKFLSENHNLAVAITGVAAALIGIQGVIGILKPITGLVTSLKGASIFSKGGSAVTSTVPNDVENIGGNGSGSAMSNPNTAKNMLAFGAAALMVGGAVWLATKGIANMAEAFKGLDGNQLKELNETLVILGKTMGFMGIGLVAISFSAGASAGPLMAFGAAVLLIGGGIGLATAGIGLMAMGLGYMFQNLKDVTTPTVLTGLNALMLSMLGLGGATLALSNPLSWIGLKMLSSSVESISDSMKEANFSSLTSAGKDFNAIATAIDNINDKKLDKLMAVSQSLSGIGGLATAIASLKNIFGESIEVKFADQKVSLEIDITNNIDGQQLGSRISRQVFANVERAKKGGQS